MDTSNLCVPFCSPQALAARMGRAGAPLLLDVRSPKDFRQGRYLLAGAQRCAPEAITELAATQPPQEAVLYCMYGHRLSADAAATLRAAGWNACVLRGGIEGGEEGVDTPQEIALWRAHRPPTVLKRPEWGVTGEQASRWITRERPKIDRIACPWLIRRFIDPRAEFFYVPAAHVMSEAARLGAVAYDMAKAPITHDDERCSFDVLLSAFDLRDAARGRLARIVRGADTGHPGLAPESAGLLALSLGLSQLHADDHAMLDAALPLYDALYAWCQSAATAVWQGEPAETHRWTPGEPGAAA